MTPNEEMKIATLLLIINSLIRLWYCNSILIPFINLHNAVFDTRQVILIYVIKKQTN